MVGIAGRTLAAIMVCGPWIAVGTAMGQTVDVNGSTAGSTAKTEKGTTTDGSNATAGIQARAPDRGQMRADDMPAAKGKAMIVPRPGPNGGGVALLNGDESGVAPRADTANATGPEGQAIRSADATAHQTVYDPNDQLGTSVEGKTRPVTGATGQNSQSQQN